ncbi:O-antigen ligase family protein [Clostridium sp. C8-1-8]|uniref:O-antigen ligase family protein n=1 Tax=Clostridium sp. C8-1-8 TaxID=2698831 RepID=UPI00136F80E1|nr:O-antigen ligase family protein [Clostridium sp. C8-1-8]
MKRNDFLILVLVLIYIIFLPLAPNSKIEWLLILLILLAGLIYGIELLFLKDERKKFKEKFKGVVFDRFTLLFLALIVLMTLSSLYAKSSVSALKEAVRFVYYFGVYLLIRFRIDKKKLFEGIISGYMISALIVSLLGIADFIQHYKPNESIQYILTTARVKATLGHPNTLGAYLVLAIFPAIMIAMRSKGLTRILYSGLSVLIVVNIGMTFSRGAWIALALGAVLIAILYNWKFIFVYIIPIAYLPFNPNIMARINQFGNAEMNLGRQRLWSAAGKMLKEHPIFGVGSGNFIVNFKDYVKRFPELQIVEPEPIPPHNSYIKMFAELGVVGGVLFIILCLEILRKLFSVRNKCTGLVNKFYAGFFVSVVSFLVMNFVDDLFFSPKVVFNFILFVSLAYNIDSIES